SGGFTLFLAGGQTITAADTADGKIAATATVTVNAAAADHFRISTPARVISGTAFDVTVIALDPFNNVDTNYQGTVTFATSDADPGAALPAGYAFQPDDGGVHTFSGGFTLITAGDQTLTATDTNSGITGSQHDTVEPPPRAPP